MFGYDFHKYQARSRPVLEMLSCNDKDAEMSLTDELEEASMEHYINMMTFVQGALKGLF